MGPSEGKILEIDKYMFCVLISPMQRNLRIKNWIMTENLYGFNKFVLEPRTTPKGDPWG